MKDADCVATHLPNISQALGLPALSTIYDLGYEVLKDNFTACNIKLVTPSEEYWT